MPGADRGIVRRQLDRLFRDGTLSGVAESQLLDRYRTRRDETAFEALVDRHGPMVLGLCRRMLHDPRDIEDAFQATFLVLVKKAPAIRDGHLLANWLYGVAYKVASRARKTAFRRRARETSSDFTALPAPDHAFTSELTPILDEELARLPDKFRAPLILCYLNGKTHEEAAELLHCPVGTVRSRMARGRDLLRTRLTHRGISPTAAIIGTGPTWSIPILTEAVPPALILATTQAALQLGSSQTIKAGAIAASVLTLTQGAVTTMNLTTLKWTSLSLLATTVSATGVVAVAYSSGPGAQGPASATVAAQQPTSSPDMIKGSIPQEKSPVLLRLEHVEEIVNRLESHESPSVPRHRPTSQALFDALTVQPAPISYATITELATRLEIALDNFDVIYPKVKEGQIDIDKFLAIRGEAILAAARLKGLLEQLRDDLHEMEKELQRNIKELDKANSLKAVAVSVAARNVRLNERKPGKVAEPSVRKAEDELEVAESQLQIKKAQRDETQARVDRVMRLIDLIEERSQPFHARLEYARTSYGIGKFRNDPDANPRPAKPPSGAVLVRPEPPQDSNPALALKTTEAQFPRQSALPNAPATNAAPPTPFRDTDLQPTAGTTNVSVRILSRALDRQLEAFQRTNPPLSPQERIDLRNYLINQSSLLHDVIADLKEQLDLQQIERKVKEAERDDARAHLTLAEVKLANVRRLFTDKNQVVSNYEVILYENEIKSPTARLAVAQARLEEVGLRTTQLQTKYRSLHETAERADKVLANDEKNAPQPGAPR